MSVKELIGADAYAAAKDYIERSRKAQGLPLDRLASDEAVTRLARLLLLTFGQ